MNALILKQVGEPVVYETADVPKPLPDQVVVQLKAAALNHRDLFITRGLYAGIKTPCILGSDGVGIVENRRVILYPALNWGDNPKVQGADFRVLGMPEQGTFAELIAIERQNIYDLPTHLNWAQGAALPLAGLTAWRALFSRCMLQRGEKILISGIGGGVALMALQFSIACGAEVWVTSGAEEKISRAKALGASGGISYHAPQWDKSLKHESGGFDVVLDSAAGDSFALLPGLCKPGARIGIYGGTLGKVNNLSMQPVFWKQISIFGSTMGSPEEFKSMLEFVQKHAIIPIVDSEFPLKAGATAFQKMERGEQFGKIVLHIDQENPS